MVALLPATLLGPVVGIVGGVLARTRVGRGWPAVLVAGLVTAAAAAATLPRLLMPDGFEPLAPWGVAEVAVCVGLACAGHLRHIQRPGARGPRGRVRSPRVPHIGSPG